MSKMGQFVFECQEVACENYNEPVVVVRQKAEQVFGKSNSFAIETTLKEWEIIQHEMQNLCDSRVEYV